MPELEPSTPEQSGKAEEALQQTCSITEQEEHSTGNGPDAGENHDAEYSTAARDNPPPAFEEPEAPSVRDVDTHHMSLQWKPVGQIPLDAEAMDPANAYSINYALQMQMVRAYLRYREVPFRIVCLQNLATWRCR